MSAIYLCVEMREYVDETTASGNIMSLATLFIFLCCASFMLLQA